MHARHDKSAVHTLFLYNVTAFCNKITPKQAVALHAPSAVPPDPSVPTDAHNVQSVRQGSRQPLDGCRHRHKLLMQPPAIVAEASPTIPLIEHFGTRAWPNPTIASQTLTSRWHPKPRSAQGSVAHWEQVCPCARCQSQTHEQQLYD